MLGVIFNGIQHSSFIDLRRAFWTVLVRSWLSKQERAKKLDLQHSLS